MTTLDVFLGGLMAVILGVTAGSVAMVFTNDVWLPLIVAGAVAGGMVAFAGWASR
jgi:hypothetical protein